MKNVAGMLLVAAVLALSAAPGAAISQSADPETAPVMTWAQFDSLLDQGQVQRFTGVSGGYVAFILCNGAWHRVRAATSDVINALQARDYKPSCPGN